jgi:hypothetical protein
MEQLNTSVKIKIPAVFMETFRHMLVIAQASAGGRVLEKVVIGEFVVRSVMKFFLFASAKKDIVFTLRLSEAIAIYTLFKLSNFNEITAGNTVCYNVLETIDKVLHGIQS